MQTLITDAKYCEVLIPLYYWISFFLHPSVILLLFYVFTGYKCLKEDKDIWKNKGCVPRMQYWCAERNRESEKNFIIENKPQASVNYARCYVAFEW